ncbi:aldo/keto reductase [Cyanobium sp. WAJ14-Wanaka]|uniref:aldo/keto reductase n=1 Tax=Cyanobium sp. WAJ14-Wanaka TaxID=2823725 RepID=UPI0020CED0AF|nr:aldo/keto reductase [Cyanobium sp. WAJ14-Wanaka]MCP9775672.1 aldo/keto reductase [Cyanobium sp. WAJ14-Wanaka]
MNRSPLSWIGGLPFGRDLCINDTYEILTSLTPSSTYVIDVADIYSAGNSLKILLELLPDLPSNILLSLKLGLEVVFYDGQFSVRPRYWKESELFNTFSSYLEKFPASRLHSFQLHTIPEDISSIDNAISCCFAMQRIFPDIFLGISNIEAYEYLQIQRISNNLFSFIQIHANILEQRLLSDFSSIESVSQPLFYVANRIQARGIINTQSKVFEDLSSRFNTSLRVKNSFTSHKQMMLDILKNLANKYDLSLLEIAYLYILSHPLPISPIHGGRSLAQLHESLSVSQTYSKVQLLRLQSLLAEYELQTRQFANIYPMLAFER